MNTETTTKPTRLPTQNDIISRLRLFLTHFELGKARAETLGKIIEDLVRIRDAGVK